jgi:glyoxylase-like metal-dependent hydrolase (beta-lactamase superfamily II)
VKRTHSTNALRIARCCLKTAKIAGILSLVFTGTVLYAQSEIPDWCRPLPRPEYKTLQRVSVSDAWFEVYRVAPAVFAVYEPHQAEETISYLILGKKRAVLFDTGMGISDIKKVVAGLTPLPIIVLNSHTHNDHVGGNWEFETIYGMDTDFTRKNAQGSREDAQAEITPDQVCGNLPRAFDRETYATRPWKITKYVHDGDRIDLGRRTLEVITVPGHTPDAISLLDRAHGLLFSGDTYYPARIWLYRPETDLEAYGASIRRLAALAPQLKMVLGAHNIPIASPSVLPRLVEAFAAVQARKIPPTPASAGNVTYKVDDMSFLMRAPKSESPQPK